MNSVFHNFFYYYYYYCIILFHFILLFFLGDSTNSHHHHSSVRSETQVVEPDKVQEADIPPNAEKSSGCLSYIFYCFMAPLVWKGFFKAAEVKVWTRMMMEDE